MHRWRKMYIELVISNTIDPRIMSGVTQSPDLFLNKPCTSGNSSATISYHHTTQTQTDNNTMETMLSDK